MNWDTNETWSWITNETNMTEALLMDIKNELEFMVTLRNIINHINLVLIEGDEMKINSANVNGNEIYVKFCELHGIERRGWK